MASSSSPRVGHAAWPHVGHAASPYVARHLGACVAVLTWGRSAAGPLVSGPVLRIRKPRPRPGARGPSREVRRDPPAAAGGAIPGSSGRRLGDMMRGRGRLLRRPLGACEWGHMQSRRQGKIAIAPHQHPPTPHPHTPWLENVAILDQGLHAVRLDTCPNPGRGSHVCELFPPSSQGPVGGCISQPWRSETPGSLHTSDGRYICRQGRACGCGAKYCERPLRLAATWCRWRKSPTRGLTWRGRTPSAGSAREGC